MLIRNVVVYDGRGGAPLYDAAVSIDGERIAWVGPLSDLPAEVAADPSVVDAEGRALLPGLINTHVHLSFDGRPDPTSYAANSEAQETLIVVSSALRSLAGGVTTVRDCGARTSAVIALADAVDNGLVAGPRVVASGSFITMTGGHGNWAGVEADGAEAVRAAVRGQAKRGARSIKLIATGGVLTPGTEPGGASYTEEELAAGVAEADRLGIPVAAHAIGTEGIKNALRAGVGSIEHGSYLDDEACELMRARNVSHAPTLSAYHTLVAGGSQDGVAPSIIRKAVGAAQSNTESFRRSVAAGVNVVCGTDAGTPQNPHGGVGLEIRLMVEGGVPISTAVKFATLNSARCLGLADQIGSIEPGKIADLILVDPNFARDPVLLDFPWYVMRDGRSMLNDLPLSDAAKEMSVAK
ncbi:amidohydrolase family protein [Georgenia yuyongxinii]|uniref:Amidohydrolase family protein n=1 Tax=Georgenia yuyongxinii TaxID=2589797 RepID=A0A5B8C5A0_9MICO|nr:amidohydrolase family protein [Georgenia yuyongxinii]QDC25704.1 amidohydrolase family protein [Georgenia yuyongxinii]